jgi:hypothetical protein
MRHNFNFLNAVRKGKSAKNLSRDRKLKTIVSLVFISAADDGKASGK